MLAKIVNDDAGILNARGALRYFASKLESEAAHARRIGRPLSLVFLDVDDFYAPLLQMIDRMVAERFLHPEQRADLWHGQDIGAMLAWMRSYTPATASKWIDEKRRSTLR